jgi:uncharacterized membrane protein YphA (DoxX/SURF4 family)
MKSRLNSDRLYIADWILRIGLALTFFCVGLMVLAQPRVWGSYLQNWAVDLLPLPLEQFMTTTGYLDIITGVLFLIPPFAFFAGILGTSHLIGVLITSGVNEGTVRDIGLLGASITVLVLRWPINKK